MNTLTERYSNIKMGNITIIGFAKETPLKNKFFAFIIGGWLSLRGYNIVAGNIVGTFRYAFLAAKMLGGRTLAMVDKDNVVQPYFVDRLLYKSSVMKKHQQVALLSSAAIIIGGGERSLHLVKEFVKQGKPIIAVTNTHGIVDNEVTPLGVKVSGLYGAVNYIISKLSMVKKSVARHEQSNHG